MRAPDPGPRETAASSRRSRRTASSISSAPVCTSLQPGARRTTRRAHPAGTAESAALRRARAAFSSSATRRIPEAADQLHAFGVVPHVSGDRAAERGDARHLGQRRRRIGHEVEHQARHRDVSRRVGQRHLCGAATMQLRSARPGAARRWRESPPTARCRSPTPGRAWSEIVAVSAPVPQPTSTQRRPGGTPSHDRNSAPCAGSSGRCNARTGRLVPSGRRWRVRWPCLGLLAMDAVGRHRISHAGRAPKRTYPPARSGEAAAAGRAAHGVARLRQDVSRHRLGEVVMQAHRG